MLEVDGSKMDLNTAMWTVENVNIASQWVIHHAGQALGLVTDVSEVVYAYARSEHQIVMNSCIRLHPLQQSCLLHAFVISK